MTGSDQAEDMPILQRWLATGWLSKLRLGSAAVVRWLDRISAHSPLYITLLAALAVLQAALIIAHEPAQDEWQGLLISLQPETFQQVLEQLRYEGHPPLFYAIIRALGAQLPAKLVLPTFCLVTALIMWSAILSNRAFSRGEALLLLMSELVLIEYITVARSLGLGVALVFAVLALWRSRFSFLPLALLPLCDFFFGVISIILIYLRWERRRECGIVAFAAGLGLWLACALVAAWSVIPAPDLVSDPPRGILFGPAAVLSQFGTLALPLQIGIEGLQWDSTIFPGALLVPVMLAIMWALTRRSARAKYLVFGFTAFTVIFALTVYPLYFRHISLVSVVLLAVYALQPEPDELARTTLRFWLVAMAIAGLIMSAAALVTPFDRSREVARYVSAPDKSSQPWVASPDWISIAVSGETGLAIYGLERRCASHFRRWNVPSKFKKQHQIIAELRHLNELTGGFYLLTAHKLDVPGDLGVRERSFRRGLNGYAYHVWRIGTPQGDRSWQRRCENDLPPWQGANDGRTTPAGTGVD